MSELEFEQDNEELFGVVNGHATPEAAEQAERLAQEVADAKQPAPDESAAEKIWMEEEEKAWRKRRTVAKCKQIAALILKVVACVLAAGLFLAAMLDPMWVPVLCYLGIAVCLIIVSIQIDRHAGRRRNGYC